MVRWATISFAVVVMVLVVVALLPGRETAVPDAAIELQSAALTLYPQSDPTAVWYFSAPEAEYFPDRQETTLVKVDDGRRTVDGVTDFTLTAESVTIDRNDDLRGEHMHAHLVEDDLDLDMTGKGSRLVLINQRAGRFEVPHAVMSGPDLGDSVFEDMRISFDFTDFSAGGPGTVGYAQFVVDSPGRNP
ncbi:MAG: hypothetical protein ROY82_12655 [Truepera sp.]|jgi:hypothetical protein|nr:hypothetical protein [Truepera sp.]